MKNESRIVELLSEMLRKFDVLTETVVKLDGSVFNLTGHVNNLTGHVDNVTGHVDNVTDRVDNLTSSVDNLTGRLDNLTVTIDLRLGKVESEIVKLNLISAENSRALLKMGDNNDRINRLEKAVFK